MLLLLRGLLGTPLALTAGRVAGTNAHSHILTAITTSKTRMASSSIGDTANTSNLAQSYAGIFAQSPGIVKAWAFSRSSDEDTETFMLQRTARDIEGGLWGQNRFAFAFQCLPHGCFAESIPSVSCVRLLLELP